LGIRIQLFVGMIVNFSSKVVQTSLFGCCGLLLLNFLGQWVSDRFSGGLFSGRIYRLDGAPLSLVGFLADLSCPWFPGPDAGVDGPSVPLGVAILDRRYPGTKGSECLMVPSRNI
jgi:hypothetical protein